MGSSPHNTLESTRAYPPRYVAAGFALGLVFVAWPSSPEFLGIAFVVGFAAVCTVSFFLAYRARALLTALFVALNALAHGANLGDSVQVGLERSGLVASSESVQIAIALISMFVIVVTLTSVAIQRRRHDHAVGPRRSRQAFAIGLAAFLAVTVLAAISSRTWTNWGGKLATKDGSAKGFELLYPMMLFATSAIIALPSSSDGRPGLRRLSRLIAEAGLFMMIFVLQSRRLMFASGILVALAILRYPPARPEWMRQRKLGTVLRVGLLGVVLLFAVVASAGWRSAASEGQVGLAKGLGSAISAAIDPATFDSQQVESRMTYLWLDSMAVELRDRMGLRLDIPEILEANVLVALPSLLYADKATVEPKSCESAFAAVGVDNDLPCTPTSEAYLGLGYAGVLLIALLWGFYVGVTDIMVRRWPNLGRLAGLVLFAPALAIESGLFPMVQGARNALIVATFVGAVALVIGFLIDHAHTQRPRHPDRVLR